MTCSAPPLSPPATLMQGGSEVFGMKITQAFNDVEQAIRSKTMRLRPQHNTTPGRVEKYQSRGFTLLE